MDVLNTTQNKKAKSSSIVRKKIATASDPAAQDKIRKMSEPATIKTQAPVPQPAQA